MTETVMSACVNGALEGVEGDQRGATDEEAGWFLMLMSVGRKLYSAGLL